MCGGPLSPEETRRLGGRCPRCGRPLTIGVQHRVEDLADRSRPAPVLPFQRLLPLPELLAACLGRGEKTKTVQTLYEQLLAALGPELPLLVQAPLDRVAELAGEPVAQVLSLLRQGQVSWDPGYDGVYGTLRLPGTKRKGPPLPMAPSRKEEE